MEPLLPLITVSNDGELEWGTVQQNKLHIADGVHILDLVAQLNVLRDGLVKVRHSGILGSPATEEGILLYIPDDLISATEKNNH